MSSFMISEPPASPGRRKILKSASGLAAAGILFGGAGWFVAQRKNNLFEVRREQTLMQTSVSITCLTADAAQAGAAIRHAFERMADTVALLTRFEPGSPLARLNRDGYLDKPPADLHHVLQRSLAISAATEGCFDISVLPVLSYLETRRQPAVLTPDDRLRIAEKDRLIDYRRIQVDKHRIQFTRPGMSVTLDGLAKGYVIDQGIAALRAAGVEDALIDAGGDLRAISGTKSRRLWHVGIVDPNHVDKIAAVTSIRNMALGTSGDYRVFYSADRTLFHVINPHTGYSPLNYSSITVTAPLSIDADAMSVAAASMPLIDLRDTLARQNHQWLVFSRDGSQRWRSADFPLHAGQAQVI
ncbi:FAD:protein FMN transferase [Castellaniella caeni]|uniref:FAD:protein FMN transferase n=1 Tax=Castellaniella caeni TaxID=266123 RepID=UPI000C9F22CE|nr:FAD:protein FMN transferase [Castellaniella caeni]